MTTVSPQYPAIARGWPRSLVLGLAAFPYLVYAALALLLLTSCAVLNPGTPTPKAMTPHELPGATVAAVSFDADGVYVGTVTKVENLWEYDVDCHFPTQFLGCKDQNAWRIEVGGKRGGSLFAFPPMGQFLPIDVGMQAVFLWKKLWVIPVARCERMGQFTQACLETQGEMEHVVPDTLFILPIGDSTLVDSLRRTRR